MIRIIILLLLLSLTAFADIQQPLRKIDVSDPSSANIRWNFDVIESNNRLWFNQKLKTSNSPTFTNLTLTGTMSVTGKTTLTNLRVTNTATIETLRANTATITNETITGILTVGATASTADFPNAKAIVSQANTGGTDTTSLLGLVVESAATAANNSSGIASYTNSYTTKDGIAVQGTAGVASDGVGQSIGIAGTAQTSHPSGNNIGVYSSVGNSGLNNITFQGVGGFMTNADYIETDAYFKLKDGVAAPSLSSGYAKIYVDTSDGDLKVIFGDGTIKTLATDTP